MKQYRADFADGEFEIISAKSNKKAITESFNHEGEHGTLFNVTLLDDDYNDVETIY